MQEKVPKCFKMDLFVFIYFDMKERKNRHSSARPDQKSGLHANKEPCHDLVNYEFDVFMMYFVSTIT